MKITPQRARAAAGIALAIVLAAGAIVLALLAGHGRQTPTACTGTPTFELPPASISLTTCRSRRLRCDQYELH